MSFPSISNKLPVGFSYDGIRLPCNLAVKSIRGERLYADSAVVNPSATATVTATGAFVGSVTARFAFANNHDQVQFTLNPIASTAEAAAATISVAALVPAKFRPASTKVFFIKGTDNSVAATLMVSIATTGNVTIAVGAAGSAFAGTGNLSVEAANGIYSLRE